MFQSEKIIIGIYLILSLIVGLNIYKNYGVSWDEPIQRVTAQKNYNYILQKNKDLEFWVDKDYGVAIELPIYVLEKIFGWKKSNTNQKNIYFNRHLSTYLFYVFGGIFLFLLVSQLFDSKTLGILALFLYLFNPRIYAHAFINSKDVPLMVMFIICFYFLFRFLNSRTFINAVIIGFCAAFLINIRIVGIIFPVMAITYILFTDFIDGKGKLKFFYKSYLIFIFSTILFTYFLWPILWKNPVGNFINFFKNMSHFRHDSYELVAGYYIKSSQDKTYFFKWFFTTLPIGYLIAGFIGLGGILIQFFKKKTLFLKDKKIRYVAFLSLFFIVPLSIVILRNSVLYNGWRQLYFVYPGFLILIVFAISLLKKIKYGKRLTLIFMLYSFIYIGTEQIILHPYENVYFNELVFKKDNSLVKNYEMDYWGHSFKEALEHLTGIDNSKKIKIACSNIVGYRNIKILDEQDGLRIFYTENLKKADYYISNAYSDRLIFGEEKLIFEIKRYNNPIISIFKLK